MKLEGIELVYRRKHSKLLIGLVCLLFGLVLGFIAGEAHGWKEEPKKVEKEPALLSPVCPSGVWIAQEILKWEEKKITDRKWKHYCLDI